jgi:hypothetical protein
MGANNRASFKTERIFYIFEGHPVTYFFDTESAALKLDQGFDGYFSGKVYKSKGWTAEYVGDVEISTDNLFEKYERAWPVSEKINALLYQGLVLRRFQEHPEAYWQEFPHLPEKSGGVFQIRIHC